MRMKKTHSPGFPGSKKSSLLPHAEALTSVTLQNASSRIAIARYWPTLKESTWNRGVLLIQAFLTLLTPPYQHRYLFFEVCTGDLGLERRRFKERNLTPVERFGLGLVGSRN